MLSLSIAISLTAFLSTFVLAKRSLVLGIATALFWGYGYGILRANVLSPASHFIFDAALVALYAARIFDKTPYDWKQRTGPLNDWVSVLVGWTLLIALIPFQTPMVTMVGLRGNMFFIPMLLLASRLREAEFRQLLFYLAGLNVIAGGFAIAEYFKGVPAFYPLSDVTLIIYRSKDVAGGNYRIPAVFANAHAYAGTMVSTLPLQLGLLGQPDLRPWQRLLAILGVASAIMGVLFANTRTNFFAMAAIIVAFIFFGTMHFKYKAIALVCILGFGLMGASNERFQRFKSVDSTDVVTDRIAGSVNRSFIEVITEYPLGNGLGGGGTSVPYFLSNQVRHAIAVENEYARIALELGVIGLVIWLCFLAWTLSRGFEITKGDKWAGSRRLIWLAVFFNFGLANIGTGMLTAIPNTMLFLMNAGFLVTKPHPEDLEATPKRRFF